MDIRTTSTEKHFKPQGKKQTVVPPVKTTTWTLPWEAPVDPASWLVCHQEGHSDQPTAASSTINRHPPPSPTSLLAKGKDAEQKTSRMTQAGNRRHRELLWCCYREGMAPGRSALIIIMLTTSTGRTATHCSTLAAHLHRRRQLI